MTKSHLALLATACSALILPSNAAEITPTYSTDLSFPMTSIDAISTNYPWLPHNVDPENNPTPEEYQNMPIQVLGNRKKIYDRYMQGCRDFWDNHMGTHEGENKGEAGTNCDTDEIERIKHIVDQTPSMVNYTDVGYKKIKAPEKVFKLILEFWEANKDKAYDEEWTVGGIFVNYWENHTKMVNVNDEDFVGGGSELHDSIWNTTEDIISEWTGQKLVGSSLYGIRVYKEGSILSPHVDRLPLISSAIINVAQDVDEPWPLEVIGHDGIATNVTMEPGEMVLYESHSIIHGRPFAMKGRYYANIFIHFMPIPPEEQVREGALPPYILEGSTSAEDWEEGVYFGEVPGGPPGPEEERKEPEIIEITGRHKAHDAAGGGDLETLIELAKEDYNTLHVKDSNGWEPIHEAVRGGNEHIIEFLHEQGVDLNSVTEDGQGNSVLDIAVDEWGHDEKYIDWLVGLGASLTKYNLGPEL